MPNDATALQAAQRVLGAALDVNSYGTKNGSIPSVAARFAIKSLKDSIGPGSHWSEKELVVQLLGQATHFRGLGKPFDELIRKDAFAAQVDIMVKSTELGVRKQIILSLSEMFINEKDPEVLEAFHSQAMRLYLSFLEQITFEKTLAEHPSIIAGIRSCAIRLAPAQQSAPK